MTPSHPVRLIPTPAPRPWGGTRFGAVGGRPVGELWVSGDEACLPDGRTLAEAGLAATVPLVKLLDVAGLLSVQVHPDDGLARELHGPEAVGKHELWVALAAEPGAAVYLGLAPGHAPDELFSGDPARVAAALARTELAAGSVIDVRPGTVHAPGAGLLLYEVQQRSDLTYRIWDWGRDRPLHHAESRRALRAGNRPVVGRLPVGPGRSTVSLPDAPFNVDRLGVDGPAELRLAAAAILSVVEGAVGFDGTTAESGSHWYLGPGGLELDGRGAVLVASWAR